MNKVLSYDEGRNKPYYPDHTKKIILVTPEEFFSNVLKLSWPVGIRGENWDFTYPLFPLLMIPIS